MHQNQQAVLQNATNINVTLAVHVHIRPREAAASPQEQLCFTAKPESGAESASLNQHQHHRDSAQIHATLPSLPKQHFYLYFIKNIWKVLTLHI